MIAATGFVGGPTPAAATPIPTVECSSQAATEVAALAMAAQCGEPVEIRDATSETTMAWALPTGAVRQQISAAPVRVRQDGDWAPVDLGFELQLDGSITSRAHPEGLILSGATTMAGDHQLAAVGVGNERVAMGWTGALPAPNLEGSKATYAEVKPGIDLVLEATLRGVESFYIVKNRAAAAYVDELTVPITGAEVDAHRLKTNGELRLLDENHHVVAASPTPLMWDARTNPSTGEPAEVRTMESDVIARTATDSSADAEPIEAGGVNLIITPDAEFLADPATVYPVTIDPTLELTDPTWDTSVREGTTTDLSTQSSLQIGGPAGNVARSFVNFDVSGLKGKHITAATVGFYNSASSSCTNVDWEIWSVMGSNLDTRWTNQPTWKTKEAMSSATKAGPGSCTAAGMIYINGLNFFQRQADEQRNIGYMGVRATVESNAAAAKTFYSQNYTDISKSPYAIVDFSASPVLTARATEASGSCVTGAARPAVRTLTPALSATFTDADSTIVDTAFEYQTITGTPIGTQNIIATPIGQAARAYIEQDLLTAGQSYRWRVKATDETSTSSDWSGWCEFTVLAHFTSDTATTHDDSYVPTPIFQTPVDDQQSATTIPDTLPVTADGETPPVTGATGDDEVTLDMDEIDEEGFATADVVDPADPATALDPNSAPATTATIGADTCGVGAPVGQTVICQRPATAAETAASDAADEAALAAGEASISSSGLTKSPPKICLGTTGQWRINRFEACYKQIYPINMWRGATPIGSVTSSVYRYSRMNVISSKWDFHLYFSVFAAAGNTLGVRVDSTFMTCNNHCTVDFHRMGGSIAYNKAKVRLDGTVRAKSIARYKRYNMQAFMTFGAMSTTSIALPTNVHRMDSNWVRCDNALKTNSTGCTVPNFVPTVTYKLNGPRPTLAKHIKNGIASQLLGKPYCGTTTTTSVQNGQCSTQTALNRVYDLQTRKDNRAQACPASLKKPEAKSCDEYPMASTRQGGMSAGINDWRTFQGCQMGDNYKTGKKGWSRCFIDADDNKLGGLDLAAFYGNSQEKGQRILDNDPFFVATPWS
jgi:hypothetical protein